MLVFDMVFGCVDIGDVGDGELVKESIYFLYILLFLFDEISCLSHHPGNPDYR